MGYDGPINTNYVFRPEGVHTYVFSLYALNTNSYPLPLPPPGLGANTPAYYTAATNALNGKVIASTNFTGTTSD